MAVTEIPYTVTGKRLDVPVHRILAGEAIEKAAGRGTTNNLAALDFFAWLAESRQPEVATR